ncbi:UNVERIFIED_CONTAM: hypothetical protein HDU68_001705, partial [Siphonaria sp. JEL0065]
MAKSLFRRWSFNSKERKSTSMSAPYSSFYVGKPHHRSSTVPENSANIQSLHLSIAPNALQPTPQLRETPSIQSTHSSSTFFHSKQVDPETAKLTWLASNGNQTAQQILSLQRQQDRLKLELMRQTLDSSSPSVGDSESGVSSNFSSTTPAKLSKIHSRSETNLASLNQRSTTTTSTEFGGIGIGVMDPIKQKRLSASTSKSTGDLVNLVNLDSFVVVPSPVEGQNLKNRQSKRGSLDATPSVTRIHQIRQMEEFEAIQRVRMKRRQEIVDMNSRRGSSPSSASSSGKEGSEGIGSRNIEVDRLRRSRSSTTLSEAGYGLDSFMVTPSAANGQNLKNRQMKRRSLDVGRLLFQETGPESIGARIPLQSTAAFIREVRTRRASDVVALPVKPGLMNLEQGFKKKQNSNIDAIRTQKVPPVVKMQQEYRQQKQLEQQQQLSELLHVVVPSAENSQVQLPFNQEYQQSRSGSVQGTPASQCISNSQARRKSAQFESNSGSGTK